MATDLYRRMIAFDYGDDERSQLMKEVWAPTPWMIDVYTGNYADGRVYDILHWCHDEFGQEGSTIHEREGSWHRGGATINGWTWYGFASENQMHCFIAAWPTPARIAHPDETNRRVAATGASSVAKVAAEGAPGGGVT